MITGEYGLCAEDEREIAGDFEGLAAFIDDNDVEGTDILLVV